MEIIRYAELKAQSWRNGCGAGRELDSLPAASAGDPLAAADPRATSGWDWRISIVEVSKAGSFPAFPGMDRVLTLVDGELLLLGIDGAEHLLEKYRPLRCSGEADSAAALPTGDVRGLDVLTRRGAFKGYTSIVELSKKRAHPVFAGQWGILLQGQGTAGPGPAVALDRYDAVVGSDAAPPEILGRGFLAVVSIDRAAGATENLPAPD